MFAKLSRYAHSAQDKLGNLLPYEHWQTLQSHSVNVGEMAAEFARVFGAPLHRQSAHSAAWHLPQPERCPPVSEDPRPHRAGA